MKKSIKNPIKQTKLTTKRFVIRKNLIGKNVTIEFKTKEGKTFKYNHDKVYTYESYLYTII